MGILFVRKEIVPRLDRTTDELTNTLRGLAGRFVPAGPSGAPTRGMARILPTGRNFYSVDIHTIPTETAWRVGVQAGDRLIEKYQKDNDGAYPSERRHRRLGDLDDADARRRRRRDPPPDGRPADLGAGEPAAQGGGVGAAGGVGKAKG